MKITPVALIVLQDDHVRLLPVAEPAGSAAERVIEQLPELIDRISALIKERNTEISDI